MRRIYFLIVAILFAGCVHELEVDLSPKLILPETTYDYDGYEVPEHFISAFMDLLDSEPGSNLLTDHGATLGRVIFYDVNLSKNFTLSCASCHQQNIGFSDGQKFSEGFEGQITGRNSMHLVNHRWNRRLFWDLHAQNLEAQVLMPIQDHVEMGMELGDLIERLESNEEYPRLFTNAFGDAEINGTRISRALAQFVRSMVSFSTRYDEGLYNDFANFTEQELQGKDLFFNGVTRCNQCHSSHNFHSTNAFNNGLPAIDGDQGQFEFTGDEDDIMQFKTPSLRNSALTAPYMHDGRFETLLEVVEHYNSGVQPYPNLDERVTEEVMYGGTPYTLDLSQEEKAAIVAFLHTLTDEELISHAKWSNPWVR